MSQLTKYGWRTILVVVFILYLVSWIHTLNTAKNFADPKQWLKKKDYKVLLIHGSTTGKERSAYMDGFQGVQFSNYLDRTKSPPNDKHANYVIGEKATILLSTPGLIGVGYTLTRAFRVVLMEPAWMRRDEEQAYSRVKRLGQMSESTSGLDYESLREFTPSILG